MKSNKNMEIVSFKPASMFQKIAENIFQLEKKRILKILPFAEVLHVGSTALSNSITKGDIDINVRVSEEHFENVYKKLEALYEIDHNNPKTSVIASFKKIGLRLPLGIQVTVIGSPDDTFFMDKEMLSTHSALLEEYNQLKKRYEGKSMIDYRKAKGKFFQKVQKEYFQQQCLEIVKTCNPGANKKDMQIFDDGWDYLVIVVNNEQAFRFARRSDYAKRLPMEEKFLEEFRKISPVKVPELMTYHDPSADLLYASYPFIPGVQLKKDIANTFTKNNLLNIAKQLGIFLTALHSFSLERAKQLGLGEIDSFPAWQDRLKSLRNNVFPYLSKEERAWTEKLFTNFLAIVKKYPVTKRVSHGDIMPEHIIVDVEKDTLSGIIDFGDIVIADPAFDFTFLATYGKDFLQTAYANYKLPMDKNFELRRKFYTDRLVITNLEHSVTLQDEEQIVVHKQQLRAYVQGNPL